MFSLVGRVPGRGELIRHPIGLEFEILDADARSIKKLRLHQNRPLAAPATASDAAAGQAGAAGAPLSPAPGAVKSEPGTGLA